MGSAFGKTFINSIPHCTLWKCDRSPACRTVMMALDAMNLSLTEIDVDMDKAEHRKPEMIAMNPRQTLPIFQDKELTLCDSHAIITYLAAQYGCPETHEKLLPKYSGGRALVDQLLFYNSGVIYPCYRAAADPILYENCTYITPEQVNHIKMTYADLEAMLNGKQWLTGPFVTLGDIAVAANISTLNVLVPVEETKYPQLSTWLYKMSDKLYFTTANNKGLGEFRKRIDRGMVNDPNEYKKCPRSSVTRRGTFTENKN